MMTVIRLFRKHAAAPGWPRWVRLTGEAAAPGSAKPGRGGRRNRRRRAAGIRAYNVYRAAFVRNPRRPLLKYLERWYRLWPPRPREAWDLGRRERRRRAKLRRRRARREARAKAQRFKPPGFIRTLAALWWLREQSRRDMERLLYR